MKPTVSIALATYNAGAFLEPQLESLLAQSYRPLEIVVSDDGSEDGTFETLLRYAQSVPQMRVLPRVQRLGFNGNFLRCFRACSGDLISPCDQDDVWAAHKTAALAAACENGGLAYCNSAFVDESGAAAFSRGRTTIADGLRLASDPPLLGLLMNNCVAGHALMFPRGLLEKVQRIPAHSYFDWWLVLLARAQGYPLRYVEQVLVSYRRHPAAATDVRDATHLDRKTQSLQSHYATAYALVQFLREPGHPATAYLQALEQWLRSTVAWPAFGFYWRHRQEIFSSKSHRRAPALAALGYLMGYRMRHGLRPRRYPAVTGFEQGLLRFELPVN